ncbi:MAG: hypothetical protein DHS80DRAFT_21312 [Piptocephalis tieghemiana]|nr:MAG: hypothetical protein DHS80DRAFT_21312 [Piptocephalis tieghemiana]
MTMLGRLRTPHSPKRLLWALKRSKTTTSVPVTLVTRTRPVKETHPRRTSEDGRGIRAFGHRLYSVLLPNSSSTSSLPHLAYSTVSSTEQESPSPTQYTSSTLPDNAYHREADRTMEYILEYLEDLGDELDLPGYDVVYSSGVLTLNLGTNGVYVLNKQPPNRQIWLSSPLSGPKRYDFDEEHRRWFYSHDQTTLDALLSEELSQLLGQPIRIRPDGCPS